MLAVPGWGSRPRPHRRSPLQGSSKQKVLVMEYCSSGSLLNVLEDPANTFGLAEPEFLIVLQCVGERGLRAAPFLSPSPSPSPFLGLWDRLGPPGAGVVGV